MFSSHFICITGNLYHQARLGVAGPTFYIPQLHHGNEWLVTCLSHVLYHISS